MTPHDERARWQGALRGPPGPCRPPRAIAPPWRRRCAAALLALALWGPPVRAAADCPPEARAPSAEQARDGLRQARDRGLLWRLEKDGQVGWLYGTLHVGRPAWAFPGPRTAQALRDADTVALELDLDDPAVAAAYAQALAALQARSAAQPLPAPLRERLDALIRADCLHGHPGFEALPPLVQALGLSALAGRRDGLDPAFAQEHMLGAFARAAGKTLVSLETPATQLAALAPEDPAGLVDAVARLVDEIESGQARRAVGRAADLWARGDLAALARWESWCDCVVDEADRAQMRRLNDARNPALAEAIVALLARGRRVFAAVGALHHTGPMALPALLQQRGVRVQRVALPAD